MLAGPDEQHLRAHERAVHGEEREERVGPRVAARGSVVLKQTGGESRAAERGQVHHQEREIVGDVERPQRGVELDAIDDAHAVRFEHDVLGSEVAVALAHEPGPCALIEAPLVRPGERGDELRERLNPLPLGV